MLIFCILIGCPDVTCAGKDEEFPKKPLGQLPPDPTEAANHVANGQMPVGQTVEDGLPGLRVPIETDETANGSPNQHGESRPASRAGKEKDTLDKINRPGKGDKRDGRKAVVLAPVNPGTVRTPEKHGPNHAGANQNSNAGTSGRKDAITPRWVKPSESKLEEAKAAALRESQQSLSAGVPPSPSIQTSEEQQQQQQRHSRSRGFVPGSNRGSNASQYDNVPGPDRDFSEVLEVELDRPPSRPYGAKQGSPTRPPSGGIGISAPPFRVPKHPPIPLSSDIRPQIPFSPGMTPVNSLYTSKMLPQEDRGYGITYAERAYGTTREIINRSPEKVLNNSFATYRHHPAHITPLQVAPADFGARMDNTGARMDNFGGRMNNIGARMDNIVPRMESSSEYGHYPRQPTRLLGSPAYTQAEQRYERQRRGEGWYGEMLEGMMVPPPRSPGGLPRSPSFQKAQLSPIHPVQEFSFPPTAVPRPTLFGGSHYRHAQEAFALQESMLL